jgi:hypothetical protein
MVVSGANIHAVFTQLVGPVTMAIAGTAAMTPGSTVTLALSPSTDVFVGAPDASGPDTIDNAAPPLLNPGPP